MRVHDESLNTYGFRVLTSGWKNREQFLANPVMLYNHVQPWMENDKDGLPIGTWEDVAVEADGIMATPVIDSEDKGFGEAVAGKVERGVIRAASIGIRIVSISEDPSVMVAGQTRPTVTEWELREISLVDIPANKNCVVLYDADGKQVNLNDAADVDKALPLVKLANQPQPKRMENQDLRFVAGFLGLQAGCTLADVQDAISDLRTKAASVPTLQAEIKKFKDAAKVVETNEAKQLLDAALTGKRITNEQRPHLETVFTENHETGKALLATFTAKVVSLSDVPNTQANGSTDSYIMKYNGKTFSELSKTEPQTLTKLKDTNFETFKALFKAEYGKEYGTKSK